MDKARLAAIPLFADLSDVELSALASVAGESQVATGEALVAEGDFGHAVYAIESGTADVIAGGVTIRSIGSGDVVGEIAVLVAGRRTASVVATSPLRVISLFKRDVWALERTAPEAARRLGVLLAEHRASPYA